MIRQCEEYKRTIKNYETAVQTLTTAGKEKHKEQKAKNKIVTQYLEQTKLDHQAEVQALAAQINELR